ncbi:MAG: hypothetical protein C6W58_06385 [Bacillaceae bacterium]|nr:MAG: hypothetical protein C6W58_06385 [Bacillaceae bacterium]
MSCENLFWKEGVPLPSKIKSILTKLFNKKYLTRGKKGVVQKVKSPLKTKNHKHRYINVSKTLKGAVNKPKKRLIRLPPLGCITYL